MDNTNIPTKPFNSSDQFVRSFFDRYYTKTLEFSANEVDTVIGYFSKRGFDDLASQSIATILLQQAKIDNVKVFKLLDTLNGLKDVQLNSLVTEILNYSRTKTSTLGYKVEETTNFIEARNIETFDISAPAYVVSGYVLPGYVGEF